MTSGALGPGPEERLARALADLRSGVPVVLRAGESGGVFAAVEALEAPRAGRLAKMSGAEVVLTERRAAVLKAMVYDGDIARLEPRAPFDLGWLRALADPAHDLDAPMKGPFKAIRGGDASVQRAALACCKTARLLPAALFAPSEAPDALAHAENLTLLDAGSLIEAPEPRLLQFAAAKVPLATARDARVHVFGVGPAREEHYAIEIGAPARGEPVLARLHSACFTGDLLGSLKCDCGPQLRAALAEMGRQGSGVLVYLNQEGRGIGLANKMRAYALQDQGFDTVEANHRLGFEDDERDFRVGAAILKAMGFSAVRLMTNNPAKMARMEEAGIGVAERVPHVYGGTAENAAYLATKASKSGHLL